MIQIENKFDVGQEVYLITEEKERIENKCTCDVCVGLGEIVYKGYKIRCPKCLGQKEIILHSKLVTMYTVDPTPYKIARYRYTVSENDSSLRYKIKKQGYGRDRNVGEEEIFPTRKEAEKACDDMNLFKEYNEWAELLEKENNAGIAVE